MHSNINQCFGTKRVGLTPLKYDTVSFGSNVFDEKKLLENLQKAIAKDDTKKILDTFGIESEEDEDGFLTISYYEQPQIEGKRYKYSDFGIDENKLFEKIKHINGDADFLDSEVSDLGNLESIGGNAYFENSEIKSLGKLEFIYGDAFFQYSSILRLDKLKYIGGNAKFGKNIKDFSNLEYIGGCILDLSNFTFEELEEDK